MNLSAWFRNGDRHLAGVHFLRPNRYSARSRSPFLNQANLSRYWPLAILLLGLAGCSGSSTASPSGGKSAAELIESGNAALARGDLDQALADFSTAVDAQPDSALARERRAAVFLQMKKFDQALNDCNEALKIDGKFAPAYFTRGLAEKDLGDTEKAIEDFTKALDNGLERVDVLTARGALYHALAKASVKPDEAAKFLEKALKDFDRAVKLDPRQAESRMQRAAVHLDLGDYESAVADCDEALKADPNWLRRTSSGPAANASWARSTRPSSIAIRPSIWTKICSRPTSFAPRPGWRKRRRCGPSPRSRNASGRRTTARRRSTCRRRSKAIRKA